MYRNNLFRIMQKETLNQYVNKFKILEYLITTFDMYDDPKNRL